MFTNHHETEMTMTTTSSSFICSNTTTTATTIITTTIGAPSVTVNIEGNEVSDPSSNTDRGYLLFISRKYP